jgi:hypothetical protein
MWIEVVRKGKAGIVQVSEDPDDVQSDLQQGSKQTTEIGTTVRGRESHLKNQETSLRQLSKSA